MPGDLSSKNSKHPNQGEFVSLPHLTWTWSFSSCGLNLRRLSQPFHEARWSLMKHHQFCTTNLSRLVLSCYMFCYILWNLSWNHHVLSKKTVQFVGAKSWIIGLVQQTTAGYQKKHVFKGSDASKSLGFMLFLGVDIYIYVFFGVNRRSLYTFSRSFVGDCYTNLCIGIIWNHGHFGVWNGRFGMNTGFNYPTLSPVFLEQPGPPWIPSNQHPNQTDATESWFWRKFGGPHSCVTGRFIYYYFFVSWFTYKSPCKNGE